VILARRRAREREFERELEMELQELIRIPSMTTTDLVVDVPVLVMRIWNPISKITKAVIVFNATMPSSTTTLPMMQAWQDEFRFASFVVSINVRTDALEA
jgi:hypothetical protein